MVFRRCKKCNFEIKLSQKKCPSCGSKKYKLTLPGYLLGAMILMFFLIIVIPERKNNTRDKFPERGIQEQKKQLGSSTISYETVARWKIPGGGEGKLIFIDPSLSSAKDLEHLMRQLKEETKGDRNALIQVFKSRDAAQMRDKLSSLTETQKIFYRKSCVGRFFKNEGQSIIEMEIMPEGINGNAIILK